MKHFYSPLEMVNSYIYYICKTCNRVRQMEYKTVKVLSISCSEF